MRKAWIGAVCIAAVALAGVSPVAAQKAIADPDQPDQPAPQQKPPKRTRHSTTTNNIQPDLDTNDQLAPSQMKQAVPGAVAQPVGASAPVPASAPAKPPVVHRAQAEPPAAAPAPAPAAVAPTKLGRATSTVVTCIGAFSKDSSHLRLAMTFDSKNVTFADVSANNGTKVEASVIYANDPKKRLEVWWTNPAARSDTYLIVINGKSTWTAPGGMKLGLTIPQLEKLNKKPFKLKGFDKDGLATVSDWDGGALATLAGGCKSGLTLHVDPKTSPDELGEVPADKDFVSTDPAIRAVKPTVSEILIGY
ncbi:MAG TPA: hypothetical protein VH206_10385 [Xanthobacteraceae bacterium]|jgi:hypothetical protein|nr:hypothetical protein [Xanthobacteraceae bacterium]